ncbi:MAG TPA: polysaccharide deacetylase family protein, partial [Accumulibacter sp.]|nr:polysaccharide deacetylase family protein [Accumulibacter sp.]
MAAITNAMTIDVEDYFQVSALAPYIAREQWDSRECRVERNVDRILLMLDEHQTAATFFTLGWVAERYPQLVRRIVEAGHELASHGYGHQRASELSEAEFSADIGSAKKLLEDLSGQEVKGYRAPSFSIGEGNLWAFDCLERAGYR